MQGQLFTTDFLLRGIVDAPAWREVDAADYETFRAALTRVFASRTAQSELNEAQTEDEIVKPILNALGFADAWLPQVNIGKKGREDVPDYLVFADAQRKADALTRGEAERPRLGLAVVEAKRWLRELDRRDEAGSTSANLKPRDFGAPSSQMLRYLSRIDVASDRAVKWGMLTNGAVWRLYWQDARSRSEEFLELNIAAALNVSGVHSELGAPDAEHTVKLFFVLFGRSAFLPQAWDTGNRTLHAIALGEARGYEEKVSAKLGERVFKEVFPQLANALALSDLEKKKDKQGNYTRAYLDEVREAALVLLYRLLFVLYAEDRRLLPAHDPRYKPYSLTDLRDEIADAIDKSKVLSTRAKNYWNRLNGLFEIIALGDDQVGMPAYNGGLFERARAPLLARIGVPDSAMAAVIDALSRRIEQIDRPRINYRDLSVAHLGGIYERLLEYSLVNEDGALVARPASFARKVSGSYYTHDDPVGLILDEAVGRLVAEKNDAAARLIDSYAKRKTINDPQWQAIDAADPASEILELKICDPAMGSGHFLVALVDWLASRVLEAIAATEERVNEQIWALHLADAGRPYVSPVVNRIADVRKRIKAAGIEHGWALDERQLDDRHIVRRMILKRVIFGVDKNPMAVELAKVALWLHTFTVGAPLSFLDHHLKCGDSLHGEKLDSVRAGMQALGVLFQDAELSRLDLAAKSLDQVADLTDTSIAEAHESKSLADEAAAQVAPIHALLSFWRALRWLVPGWPTNRLPKIKDETQRAAIAELFSGRYNLAAVAMNGAVEGESAAIVALNVLLAQARALAERETFFHWWTEFPTVWRNGSGADGGFDAVIGNPPWDRIKLQEVEWFAERKPEIAMQARAADRKLLIEKEHKRRTPLWADFVQASSSAEATGRVVRESGEYPLLSGGDVNLYSLFVERAAALVRGNSIVGLLTPSGIAADKGASEFFRSITSPPSNDLFDESRTRLAALYDFENRGNPGGSYFPDVDSRFKFCAFIFGGEQRRFDAARCAFFLHSLDELNDPDRVLNLSANDFTRVNPNTGAAPIFRTQRDAELTSRIYSANPVLVRHEIDAKGRVIAEHKAWPVRYATMFHMTNDSDKFITRAELEKTGWKPAPLNRWTRPAPLPKRGKLEVGAALTAALAVPLYEGKMVQMFDHRAADVVMNVENLARPAQQLPVDDGSKRQFDRFPMPQYWMRSDDVTKQRAANWSLAFKSISSPTNVRTMIASVIPQSGVGNSMALFAWENPLEEAQHAPLLMANMCSFVLDFVLRQKVQGQNLNWFIVEQLPVIAPDRFNLPMVSFAEDPEPLVGASTGSVRTVVGMGQAGRPETIADFIRAEVLALTYTAHDMAPFARDMGYVDGSGELRPPFMWDAEDRAHRMARLDAIFMRLYGLSEDDAGYVLSTFPIVKKQDEAAHGNYRTRDLIVAYMRRLIAGTLTHQPIVLLGQ
jgi:hypothetical protein